MNERQLLEKFLSGLITKEEMLHYKYKNSSLVAFYEEKEIDGVLKMKYISSMDGTLWLSDREADARPESKKFQITLVD